MLISRLSDINQRINTQVNQKHQMQILLSFPRNPCLLIKFLQFILLFKQLINASDGNVLYSQCSRFTVTVLNQQSMEIIIQFESDSNRTIEMKK